MYPALTDVSGRDSVVTYDGYLRTAFSGFEYVFLDYGSGAADNMSASPATTYTIVLDGAAPDTAPGDKLLLHSGGMPYTLTGDSSLLPDTSP